MKNLKISDWPARPLTIKVWRCDQDLLARGFKVSERDLAKSFSSAKTATQFAPLLAALAYGYAIEIDQANQDHDLIDLSNEDAPRRFVLRSFVDGKVTFQRSKFLGTKRKTRPIDLERSIRKLHGYILADFRGFPEVRFTEIPSEAIAAAVYDGIIGIHGIKAKNIDSFLRQNFRVTLEDAEENDAQAPVERIRYKPVKNPGQQEMPEPRQMDFGL